MMPLMYVHIKSFLFVFYCEMYTKHIPRKVYLNQLTILDFYVYNLV